MGLDRENMGVIVEVVTDAVGRECPIVLCGSRARGEPSEESDYDLFVVLPGYHIPFCLTRLREAGNELRRWLEVDVSLNPVPRFRLNRPGTRLLAWKVCREGTVLASPAGFTLKSPGPFELTPRAAFSYAISAVRFLIADLDPAVLGSASVPPNIQRAIRKALLHTAQLHLLGRGRYESTLASALAALPPSTRARLAALAAAPDRPLSWFETRNALLSQMREVSTSWPFALGLNMQYAIVTWLREGRRNLAPLLRRQPITAALERSLLNLVCAVTLGGGVEQALVDEAAYALPDFLRRGRTGWQELRDLVEHECCNAHLLMGL